MNKRMPPEALAYYLGLGHGRSYQAVADHFGVSKRTVTATAARERWQAALEAAESKSREQIGQRYAETLEQANERHVKLGRFLQAQGISALKNAAMSSSDSLRAIKTGVDIERLGLGEPADPTQDVEDIIRREYQRWLRPAEGEGSGAGTESGDDSTPPATSSDGADGGSDRDDTEPRDAAA